MSAGRVGVRLASGALVFLLLAGFVAREIEVGTEVTHFIASEEQGSTATLVRALANSASARSLVLSIGGPEVEARAAARELARRLAEHADVESARSGPPTDLEDAVRALYFERRFRFLSDRPQTELPDRLSDAGLARAAAELERGLRGPMAPFYASIGPLDPYLSFPRLLERFEDARPGRVEVRDGQFVSPDGQALVFLTSRASPFDTARGAPLLAAIDDGFASLDAAAGGELTLEKSGIHRFALDGENQIRGDMQRISTVATIGVLALLGFAFQSIRMVAIVSLPLVFGMLAGSAGTLALFGSLHGLTLAFGASLIGVAVDYPTHLAAHHLLGPRGRDIAATLRSVRVGIVLAAATSFVGFAALAGARLPGIRELGVFSLIGLSAALVSTFWLVPPLLAAAPPAPDRSRRIAHALARAVSWIALRRGFALGLGIGVLIFCGGGFAQVRFEDDPGTLSPESPTLLAEDVRVRARIGALDLDRAVVALGGDREEALRRNDAVAIRLASAVDDGVLEGFQGVHPFLWSRELQDENLEALARTPDLFARTQDAFTRAGFQPDALAPFASALAARPAPLTYDDLLASPLAVLVRGFEVPLPDGTAFVTFLRGVHDASDLQASLAGVEGVEIVDQRSFLSGSFRSFREQTLQLVGLGLVAVLVLLALRYRHPGPVLAAFLPALLAALATAAGFAWMGAPLHLVHLLGLLLVLSMGVDYGVFLVESAREHRQSLDSLGASAFGVVIDCGTTVLSFGLLATSSNPALHALGVTISVGVVSSLLLAPIALVISPPTVRTAP